MQPREEVEQLEGRGGGYQMSASVPAKSQTRRPVPRRRGFRLVGRVEKLTYGGDLPRRKPKPWPGEKE